MSDKATIVFIPHGGGPLPLLNEPGHARLNQFLCAFPATIEKPDAIIVVSAHWEESVVAITAAESPSLLFDYSGFPPESYEYQYPAPGNPDLARRVQGLLQQAGIDSNLDHQRGFDHGVFVPLIMMYPQADIPCIQVSLSTSLDAAEHVAIGKALTPLKGDKLLILGSGFSFHNMQALMSKRDDSSDSRNKTFETWLAQTCTEPGLSEQGREARLIDWEAAPQARYCHPREEHLLPLQVCYGVGQSAARMVFQDKVEGFVTSAYQWN